MPTPSHCPNPSCRYHSSPPDNWFIRFGFYGTRAFGAVQRYCCCACGKTCSAQTESPHYFAKRKVPLQALWESLTTGAAMRACATRYHVSPAAIQSAVLRLGRQAMGAHLQLTADLNPRHAVVFDGLRSFVTSQDYPCDITTVVDRQGELIHTMTHTISRRGGRMTEKQRERVKLKALVWMPRKGKKRTDISLLVHELWNYLRPPPALPDGLCPARIDTDEDPVYRSVLSRNPVCAHQRQAGALRHVVTPGSAPRTMDNPLFPVNYVDRLIRHRIKEHTRESIAFGRHAVMQMHRAWIFACDHNYRREWRARQPHAGVHAELTGIPWKKVTAVNHQLFTRRLRVGHLPVPETIRSVWLAELATPPIRWKVGQKGTSVRVPAYARRDLGG